VFSGRARRKEYWLFTLFNIVIVIVLAALDMAIGTGGILAGLYELAILIPALAVTVRRLHDTGRSGWFILIGIIPIVGAIVLLVFAVQDSHSGDNAYGPNPKETHSGEGDAQTAGEMTSTESEGEMDKG
jgi:uncharacterized membrane protein YhaH (DUF805 family)